MFQDSSVSQQGRSDPSRHPARGPHRICARPRRTSSPLLQNLVFSTHNGVPPSNRWTSFKTELDARVALRLAKAELAQLRGLPPSFNRQVNQNLTPKDATWVGDDSDTSSSNDQTHGEYSSAETSGNDCGTPFYISGYPGGDAFPATGASANDTTTVSPPARPEDGESPR